MTFIIVFIALVLFVIFSLILIYLSGKMPRNGGWIIARSIGRNSLFAVLGGGIGIVSAVVLAFLFCAGSSPGSFCELQFMALFLPIIGIVGIVIGLFLANITGKEDITVKEQGKLSIYWYALGTAILVSGLYWWIFWLAHEENTLSVIIVGVLTFALFVAISRLLKRKTQ